MADSRRFGAGGKIVANRRKQRLSSTPYDRPSPSPSQPPPDKSPGWFSGRILPSARTIASGAGKLLASVLYSESSSSSEDEDEDSVADGPDNDHKLANDGVNALHERIETKRIIEQLVMQETFLREECDRLTELLKSRVIDWSTEAEKRLAASPLKMTDNEVGNMYNKAVLEAKKWFQEKKMGPSSVAKTDDGTYDLNPSVTAHVKTVTGSPVDVARSYMRDRPPWASPTKQIELSTPLTAKMELINDGTSYSVGHDSLSSSKKRSSVASGSWNIQEELRRVRAKATEDMLRTPSSMIDRSLLAVATSRQEGMSKKTTEPDSFRKSHQVGVLMDAGVISDPALAALESRQDGKASEALSTKPATLSSGNNEDSKVGQIDGESFTHKLPCVTSSKSEELHSDPHGPPAKEVTEIGGRPGVNGFLPSQTSLSAGGVIQNHEQDNEDSRNTDEDKSVSAGNLEGRCELLTETCVEVPIVTETASIASGSQNSLSMQHEELPEEMIQPSTDGKTDPMHWKQQAKKSSGNLRRSKRRGK